MIIWGNVSLFVDIITIIDIVDGSVSVLTKKLDLKHVMNIALLSFHEFSFGY